MRTTTRHGVLIDRMRDLVKIVRLVRQLRTDRHPAVPPGMVGMLTHIDETCRRTSGCHAKELAARSGLDQSTVSRAVATLVADGLVDRHADPADRRASVLALTDAGRAALTDAETWYDDLLGRALAGWRPDEVAALTDALGRLVTDLEHILDGASSPTSERQEAAR